MLTIFAVSFVSLIALFGIVLLATAASLSLDETSIDEWDAFQDAMSQNK